MSAVRRTLGALFLLLALASALRTLPPALRFLSNQRSSYADVTRDNPNLVPQFQGLLPVQTETFFAAHLRRGERYYVQVPPARYFTGVDLPTAVRTFARFELLPAIWVDDPHRAEVVLSVGDDPAKLGLRYSKVERSNDGRDAVATVAP